MLPPVLTVSFTLTVSHGGSNQRAGLFLLRPELRWMQLVLDLSTSGFINVDKMAAADVIVLSTPVYFYQMNAQMKTLIDRTMACYYDERLSGKAFYFIVTAAEDKPALERTMDGLRGLTDCIPDAKVCGCIYGANAWQLGDIQGNPALHEAYEMGKAI